LKNLHNVTTCTYIVILYTISPELAKTFADHYYDYRASFTKLLSNVQSRSNHHYASYIPELLLFWGLLIKLSEFPYEHHNGLLQKINTNNHLYKISFFYQFLLFNDQVLGELDLIMLWQVCQHGHLGSLLERMFENTNHLNFLEDQPLSLTQRAQQSWNATCLSETIYETILICIQ